MGHDVFKTVADELAANPAHATDHESGGADEITGANLELTKSATNYTPTSDTLGGHQEGIDAQLGLAAGAVAIPAPDWCPPAFKWKDGDEIYVQAGRYWLGKHRYDGAYQSLTGLAAYLDVSSRTAVDVDGTYSAGTTSGMLGGAKVNSAWYSAWLTAADPIVLVLPYIRVYAIDYNSSHAGKTTINPGDHFTGLSAENGFILSDDALNDYQLMLLKREDPTIDGEMFTVEDTVNGTPDEIILDGDQTAYIVEKAWLQLIPPAATDCVYLGDIPIDSGGDVLYFDRSGWRYQFDDFIDVSGVLHGTTPGNTDVCSAISPNAARGLLQLYTAGNSATSISGDLYSGTAGADVVILIYFQGASGNLAQVIPVDWLMSATGMIRNKFRKNSSSAADTGVIRVYGFEL